MTDYGEIRSTLRTLNERFSAFDGWVCPKCGGSVVAGPSGVACQRCGHPTTAR